METCWIKSTNLEWKLIGKDCQSGVVVLIRSLPSPMCIIPLLNKQACHWWLVYRRRNLLIIKLQTNGICFTGRAFCLSWRKRLVPGFLVSRAVALAELTIVLVADMPLPWLTAPRTSSSSGHRSWGRSILCSARPPGRIRWGSWWNPSWRDWSSPPTQSRRCFTGCKIPRKAQYDFKRLWLLYTTR